MLKNQNGYPRFAPEGCRPVSFVNCSSGGQGNDGGITMTYDEASAKLKDVPLAYVYAPTQAFRMLYSAKDALAHGTLFEELYKPMEVYGNE